MIKDLKEKARKIKKDIIKTSFSAGVGHIGSSFSIADILTILYFSVLRIDPNKPLGQNRDRFILSKGHAAAALYAVLYNRGFFSKEKLFTFCKNGGLFGVHPEYNPKFGIELSTGSLGHGLSVGVGMALGLKISNKSKSYVPRVFVLISDSELNEGSTWEAIMFASQHNLDNLIVIVDNNKFQAFGKTDDVIKLNPIEEKWKVFGWQVKKTDGHNLKDLQDSFRKLPFKKDRPSVIVAKTKNAKGLPFFEDKQEAHYMPLDEKKYRIALEEIEKI